MKKMLALLLAAILCITAAACGSEKPTTPTESPTAAPTEPPTAAPTAVPTAVPTQIADPEDLRQQEIDAFYAEGRKDRTELEFGVTYLIRDGLNMTATECFIREEQKVEYADLFGADSLESVPVGTPTENTEYVFLSSNTLYFRIILENTSDERLYIRRDGVYRDGMYYLEWGSDVRANIQTKRFGEPSVGSFWADGIAGVIKTPDASDYVFKEEELGDPVRHINCGNHICLEPGQQGAYFLKVCTVMGDFSGNNPWYAVITFDNYEFFCDLAALVKNPE